VGRVGHWRTNVCVSVVKVKHFNLRDGVVWARKEVRVLLLRRVWEESFLLGLVGGVLLLPAGVLLADLV
jgi:hypothetical protein